MSQDARVKIRQLRAQRDRLLEACEAAWRDYGNRGDITAGTLELMERAIAAVNAEALALGRSAALAARTESSGDKTEPQPSTSQVEFQRKRVIRIVRKALKGRNSSKHTPGPWRVCVNYGCENQVTSLSGIVATAEDGYAATRQEALANARLIASAPDLLAQNEIALELAKAVLRLNTLCHDLRLYPVGVADHQFEDVAELASRFMEAADMSKSKPTGRSSWNRTFPSGRDMLLRQADVEWDERQMYHLCCWEKLPAWLRDRLVLTTGEGK